MNRQVRPFTRLGSENLLRSSIVHNDVSGVETALSAWPNLVNARFTTGKVEGQTPLFLAVLLSGCVHSSEDDLIPERMDKKLAIIRLLINKGADPNAVCKLPISSNAKRSPLKLVSDIILDKSRAPASTFKMFAILVGVEEQQLSEHQLKQKAWSLVEIPHIANKVTQTIDRWNQEDRADALKIKKAGTISLLVGIAGIIVGALAIAGVIGMGSVPGGILLGLGILAGAIASLLFYTSHELQPNEANNDTGTHSSLSFGAV